MLLTLCQTGVVLGVETESCGFSAKTCPQIYPQGSWIKSRARANLNRETVRFGIELLDVRLRRPDFPAAIAHAVYDRMRSGACPLTPDEIQKPFEYLKRAWGKASNEARGKFTNWLTSQ